MTDEIQDTLHNLGLTIETTFIPWSQSRNKDEKDPSLNWHVTLKVNDRDIFTCDYSAGMAHCPAYKQPKYGHGSTLVEFETIKAECEKGKAMRYWSSIDKPIPTKRQILPKTEDVFHSLVLDADAINYASYEDWADSFGYDSDSRKGEEIYQTCLRYGLAIRAALPTGSMEKLQNTFQDY